jgi:ribosomal protein S18 acetylase RimI-like enzyme
VTAPAVRALQADDLPALRGVIAAAGLFPPALLDAMTGPFLAGAAPEAIWLTAQDGGAPAGLAYCVPEPMTDRVWNLLLIAVHPERQGRGLGAALMRHVERRLSAAGARMLIVETSGLPAFAGTRRFYKGLGYEPEGRVRDFYAQGEAKVILRRLLAAA